MSRPPRLTWRGRSHRISRARTWHQRGMCSRNVRYRVNLLGVIRNPTRKPLLHKGRKP